MKGLEAKLGFSEFSPATKGRFRDRQYISIMTVVWWMPEVPV